jgi:hypothetical protein
MSRSTTATWRLSGVAIIQFACQRSMRCASGPCNDARRWPPDRPPGRRRGSASLPLPDRTNCPEVPYTWRSSRSARTCHAVNTGGRSEAAERPRTVLIAEPAAGREEPTGGNHALVRPRSRVIAQRRPLPSSTSRSFGLPALASSEVRSGRRSRRYMSTAMPLASAPHMWHFLVEARRDQSHPQRRALSDEGAAATAHSAPRD